MPSVAFLTAEVICSMVFLAAERQVSFMVSHLTIYSQWLDDTAGLICWSKLAIAGELSLDIYVVSLSAKGFVNERSPLWMARIGN